MKRLRNEERTTKAFASHTVPVGLDLQADEEASEIIGSLLGIGTSINTLDLLV